MLTASRWKILISSITISWTKRYAPWTEMFQRQAHHPSKHKLRQRPLKLTMKAVFTRMSKKLLASQTNKSNSNKIMSGILLSLWMENKLTIKKHSLPIRSSVQLRKSAGKVNRDMTMKLSNLLHKSMKKNWTKSNERKKASRKRRHQSKMWPRATRTKRRQKIKPLKLTKFMYFLLV